jgi:phosphoribosylformylglycinamidine synthase
MSPPKQTYRHIEVRSLDGDALERLSNDMKLSLSREDMIEVQKYFNEANREPTDVELEVIAQTWSEHCKHRIFGALIQHEVDGVKETVDGLFKTHIKEVTEGIWKNKPDFILGAFVDNAGFVRLDDKVAVCLKVETHNHPSAIEPYAGANTGLGGVIRDILGAGKGAKPVASLDVFCFGSPNTKSEDIKADDVLHPLGIMRGVVRGVRDYGNRMGIPTVSGAIQFDPAYIYNPLVFCGTAGTIPIGDIEKEVLPGHKIVAVGGRTGKDGLHGATFSSASLTTDSHEEDQQAVQIGNPIEEKKACDFVLEARDRGLIGFITDCGAGGFSSAAGEMLSVTGGELYLENAPLKEPGLVSWEIFLSESQERMVLAVDEKHLPKLQELADTYETEAVVLGHADGSGILKVWHEGELVVELDCSKLHEAPRQTRHSKWTTPSFRDDVSLEGSTADLFKKVLGDFAVVSREPIIREYDHEVQGNTFLKPLGGATGDAPQDGSVIHIDGSKPMMSMALSLLPEWGKTAPYEMGLACVDECVRQLVICGADPKRLALLDNFCMGNPDDETELGCLVETTKGMAEAATFYQAPFVSGKDSFYNFFETEDGPISVPVTLVISGLGIIDDRKQVVGSSLRHDGSALFVIGKMDTELGGSVAARVSGITDARVPKCDLEANLARYENLYNALQKGLVAAAHDVSEGGLITAIAEMAFSMKVGLEIDTFLSKEQLFAETPGCIVVEVESTEVDDFKALFGEDAQQIGKTTSAHKKLVIADQIEEDLTSLKERWQHGLTPYY